MVPVGNNLRALCCLLSGGKLSSRLRKKRNQASNRNRSMSDKSVAKLLATSHDPTGCMYGVHTWEYTDKGHDIWFKTCITETNGRVCGATYEVTEIELEWVKKHVHPLRQASVD